MHIQTFFGRFRCRFWLKVDARNRTFPVNIPGMRPFFWNGYLRWKTPVVQVVVRVRVVALHAHVRYDLARGVPTLVLGHCRADRWIHVTADVSFLALPDACRCALSLHEFSRHFPYLRTTKSTRTWRALAF